MAKSCWGEDSDLLRLNVSRQPIEAGPTRPLGFCEQAYDFAILGVSS
jgi:hypothetical protein